MLQVPIDKILPITDARANISQLVNNVEKGDIYVLTRGGKPAVVVCSVDYIKKLTDGDIIQKSETPPTQTNPISTPNETPAQEPTPENLPQEKPAQPAEPAVYQAPATAVIQEPEQEEAVTTYQEPVNTPAEEESVPVNISSGSQL